MILKFVTLLAAVTSAHAAEPILSTLTDDSTVAGWSVPSVRTANAVFESFDPGLKILLRAYFKEHKEVRNKRYILAERKASICAECPKKYAFVRTSSKHYSPLTGVHTFSYWILDSRNQVIRYGGADRVDVVATGKPLASVDETNCTAARCYKTRYDFDGKRYVANECQEFDMEGLSLGGCKFE